MVKFELKNLDENLFSQKMRDVFKSLVDVYDKKAKMGYLKCIPSNYGYVYFWYDLFDEEAIDSCYKNYVSKAKSQEIEEARKEEGEYFLFREYLDLFPIVYDHPDVIEGGHAEVYLATLLGDFEKASLDKVIASLKIQTKKLEKLEGFVNKYFETPSEDFEDMEIIFKTIRFGDLRLQKMLEKRDDVELAEMVFATKDDFDDETYDKHVFQRNGWEICLRVYFDADDILEDVVAKIDKVVSPLKGIITKMVRYEQSCSPF